MKDKKIEDNFDKCHIRSRIMQKVKAQKEYHGPVIKQQFPSNPLEFAIKTGLPQIVKSLIDKGLSPIISSGKSEDMRILEVACDADLKTLEILVKSVS